MDKVIKTEDIISFMKENKLSKRQFCLRCRICVSVLNKILNNQINFDIIALFRIAKLMNREVYTLFV